MRVQEGGSKSGAEDHRPRWKRSRGGSDGEIVARGPQINEKDILKIPRPRPERLKMDGIIPET